MYEGMCVVLDLGGYQAASIARKVRGEGVYCEVLPYDAPVERIRKRAPRGLILAGGAGNPFAEGAPVLPRETIQIDLPMLGLGFGAGAMLRAYGAKPQRSMPGRQTVEVAFQQDPVFEGLTQSERLVQRLDQVELPEGFASIAEEKGGWSVAFAHQSLQRWGIQFYPEQNDPDGLTILENFTLGVCGCEKNWDIERFIDYEIDFIRRKVGDGQVLMTLSGGVDSTVCAALMQKAVGDRLRCVYVDTGFMRAGDGDAIRQAIEKVPGLRLNRVEMGERFMHVIEGVSDPVKKRRLISAELLEVFEQCAGEMGGIDCLARGSPYVDLLSRGAEVQAASHERDSLKAGFTLLMEPLCRLFKSEVRLLGEVLGLPEEITRQQAFPGAGLALRCLGCVTEEKLKMLRAADRIFREEVQAAGLDRRIRQYFAVLTDMSTRDAQERPGFTVALRAVNWTNPDTATAYRLPYDLLERVVERTTSEVEGVNRVVYDVTGKPPAGIEWD